MTLFSRTITAVATITAIGWAGLAHAQTVLRYNEGGPNRGTRAEAIQYFADRVEELSGGDMKIEVIWGGALLKFSATADGIKNGVADMGTVLTSYAPNQMMALSIGDLPIGESSDAWIGMRAMYDLLTTNEQLQKSLARQNSVYITNFHSTALQINCSGGVGLDSIDDIAGLKMRASGIYAKVLSDLGANMINLTFDEVYQAHDSGLINCDAGYFYTIKAYKLGEVLSSVYRVNFGQIGGFAVVANQDRWNALSDEQRTILRQAGSDMIDHFAKSQITEIDTVIETLEAEGKVTIVDAPDSLRDGLFAAAQPYLDGWKDEFSSAGFDADTVMSEYEGLLAKYTQERDSQGYPWAR